MVSNSTWIPDEKDLTVPQDITLSTPSFKAAAVYMNLACEPLCKEFMLCRRENMDPRKCIHWGKQVTDCGVKFLQKVKQTCRAEFENYATCFDYSDEAMSANLCRPSQLVYDRCMMEKHGMRRPLRGYFAKPHIIKTDTPRPENPLNIRDYDAEARAVMQEIPPDRWTTYDHRAHGGQQKEFFQSW